MTQSKNVNLPSGVTVLPRGVEVHGRKIRISFTINGKRYREVVAHISDKASKNKANINYAQNKRQSILTEIEEGRFDYAAHFPKSKNAKKFSGWGGPNMDKSVSEAVGEWIQLKDKKTAPSTSSNYRSKSKKLIEKWPEKRLRDITQMELEFFQCELLEKGLSPKTVNETFIVVRGVWETAFNDGIIRSNPLHRIRNVKTDKEEMDEADPFTLDELKRIESVKTIRQQNINLIMFGCWCGLSVSELLGLSWDDVDLENGTITVRRAYVNGEYKVPKEPTRLRRVDLLEPAKKWLRRQKAATFLLPPSIIKVRQRNNVTFKEDTVRLVFRNGQSNQPWHYHSLLRWFAGHLKRAKVRYRSPNQCRHTFASRMVSNYVSLEWVARQLGHADTTMVKKHYGRWIPQDTPNIAEEISRRLGYEADTEGLKNEQFAPILPQNEKSPDFLVENQGFNMAEREGFEPSIRY